MSGRVERGDWRREQSGQGKALWKGLWVRVEGEVIRWRGGERLLAVDDFCWSRLLQTRVYQPIDKSNRTPWRQG